ncbi:Cytochrome P450 [Dillenia turbinata]|uniref:Cytochrome P450 n=1 Tax=Dillenia turbinata TaxID=194707 RepID=A0AAN8VSN3_9MAGN
MEFIFQTLVTERVALYFPILSLLSILLLTFKYFSSSSTVPPGPKPWPIIGNIFQMGEKPHLTLTRYAKTYGPLISLRLGMQTLVVGSSKEAAEEILKIHDRNLSGRSLPHVFPAKRHEINDLPMGWNFVCGKRWKYLRTVCRSELFSGKAIECQACTREEKVRELIQYISKMEGKRVKISETVFTTVYNALSNIMVSRDFMSLEEESAGGGMKGLVRAVTELAATPNISDFYPVFAGLDLQGVHKKSMVVFSKLCDAWMPIIKERQERKVGNASKTQDFLDALLNNSFTDAQINHLFAELFVAGTDSSTSTIEWTMAELIRNPETMKRVREELTREIHQNVVKEAHLSQLPYLQACIKETLRLHPPGPFLLPHRALKSCQVMNYTIPKDALVVVNICRSELFSGKAIESQAYLREKKAVDMTTLDYLRFLPIIIWVGSAGSQEEEGVAQEDTGFCGKKLLRQDKVVDAKKKQDFLDAMIYNNFGDDLINQGLVAKTYVPSLKTQKITGKHRTNLKPISGRTMVPYSLERLLMPYLLHDNVGN